MSAFSEQLPTYETQYQPKISDIIKDIVIENIINNNVIENIVKYIWIESLPRPTFSSKSEQNKEVNKETGCFCLSEVSWSHF